MSQRWYQCDEEEYDSSVPPEEQEEHARTYAIKTIAAMRQAVAGVSSYCERYRDERYEREQREMADRAERRQAWSAWVDSNGGRW